MVKINNEYIVDIDERNYTLKRLTGRKTTRENKKTGETEEVDSCVIVGYYGDLAGAIKATIADMNRRDLRKGAHSLEEALNIVIQHNIMFNVYLEKCLTELGG